MLGIKEKLSLQKTVKEGIDRLKAGISDLRTRLGLQKEVKQSLDKLKGKAVTSATTLLDRFLSNEFINSTVEHFLKMLAMAVEEVKDGIILLQNPIIAFCDAHKSEMVVDTNGSEVGAVLESAINTVFNGHCPQSPSQKSPSAAIRVKPDGLEYGSAQTITIDIDTEFDSPETFREIIRAIEQARSVDTLVLKINSQGGRTDSAQAIYVALLETPARTIAKVITAYSSGSIVAMACDEIKPTPHCTMMVHNASTGAWGKLGEMKAQSTFMENHFKMWFRELYEGFLSGEEIDDIFKGQDIWLREEDVRKRLLKWKPVRERRSSV